MSAEHKRELASRLILVKPGVEKFASSIGLQGLRIRFKKPGAVSEVAVVGVEPEDRLAEITVNAHSKFAGLIRSGRRRVILERAADQLDAELKAKLFWTTVSERWRNVNGIAALAGALNSSFNAFLHLYDERRLIAYGDGEPKKA